MGIRRRNGEKKIKQENNIKLHNALKEHTRAKALRELSNGADFNDKKYTEHRNHHVRDRAWALAGNIVPETEAERKSLCDSLTKGRTLAAKLALETRFGFVKEDQATVKAA